MPYAPTPYPPVKAQMPATGRPGGATTGGRAPGGASGQPPTAPPQQHTDQTGQTFQWSDGGFAPPSATNSGGPQPGQWNPVGPGRLDPSPPQAGPGPGGGGPRPGTPNPFDFWSEYTRSQSQIPQIPARVPGLQNADNTAAQAAVFGRAKDRIGLSTQGLLKSIRSNFARRGISGSSLAMGQEGEALEHGAGQIGDTIREQAVQDLRRREEIQNTNYRGDIDQRGQDAAAEAQRQQMIIQLVNAARGGRY